MGAGSVGYAKVHEEYWDGDKIARLSDRAALLGLFLLSGPHRNAIGCFRLGVGAITDIPRFGGWGIEGVSDALREMVDTGFIVRDEATGWTLVVNHLRKDPIDNERTAVHALAMANKVPLSSPVYRYLFEILEPQLKRHPKFLEGKDGWPMASPIEAPSKGHTMPMPSPLPEPLPEPEPEPRDDYDSRAREVSIIQAFDRGVKTVFGSGALERAYPHTTDYGTARTWIEAGADAALIEAAVTAACARKKAKGERPPRSLSGLNLSISDAIAAAKKPLPESAAPAIPPAFDRSKPWFDRWGNFDAAKYAAWREQNPEQARAS